MSQCYHSRWCMLIQQNKLPHKSMQKIQQISFWLIFSCLCLSNRLAWNHRMRLICYTQLLVNLYFEIQCMKCIWYVIKILALCTNRLCGNFNHLKTCYIETANWVSNSMIKSIYHLMRRWFSVLMLINHFSIGTFNVKKLSISGNFPNAISNNRHNDKVFIFRCGLQSNICHSMNIEKVHTSYIHLINAIHHIGFSQMT